MSLLLRLLPYIIGAVVLGGIGIVVKGWHDDAQKLPQVQQEFAVYRTGQETAARVRKEVSGEYQGEIATLRAGQRQPAPAVRLCQQAPAVPASGTTGGSHGAGATGGQLPEGTGTGAVQGRDIGAELFRLADRADELTAQLRACQSFVGKVATQ